MLTGEIVFMSEPVFRQQPNNVGNGIYYDDKTIMVITGDGVIYAYSDEIGRYRFPRDLGYADFSREGIRVTLDEMRSKVWKIPVTNPMVAERLRAIPEGHRYSTYVIDVNVMESHIMAIVFWSNSIFHIQLDLP